LSTAPQTYIPRSGLENTETDILNCSFEASVLACQLHASDNVHLLPIPPNEQIENSSQISNPARPSQVLFDPEPLEILTPSNVCSSPGPTRLGLDASPATRKLLPKQLAAQTVAEVSDNNRGKKIHALEPAKTCNEKKRRKFTDDEKKMVKSVRRRGVCLRCRFFKEKVCDS
jgi:hypothetical protein